METERKKHFWIIFAAAAILVVIIAFSLIFAFNKAYYIDFRSEGGSRLTSVRYKGIGDIQMPKQPARIGHVFGGWYIDSAFTQPFDLEELKKKRRDVVLYAKWEKEKFDIEFVYEDKVVRKTTYEYGDSIIPPDIEIEEPEKYELDWYSENGKYVHFPISAFSQKKFIGKLAKRYFTINICFVDSFGKERTDSDSAEYGELLDTAYFLEALNESYNSDDIEILFEGTDSSAKPVLPYTVTGDANFRIKIKKP